MFIHALLALVASAPICRTVHITATLDDSLTHVSGSASCTVAQAGPVYVVTYPRMLASPDVAGLTDITRTWFYPAGFSPAAMQLTHHGHSLLGDGAWQYVTQAHVGEVVQLAFDTQLPQRNGTFGVQDKTAYLLGGWHPGFGQPDNFAECDITYEVRVPSHTVGFVGHTPYGRQSPRLRHGQWHGHFVPWLNTPQAHVARLPHGVLVRPVEAAGDFTDFLDDSAETQLRDTLAAAAAFAQTVGLTPQPQIYVYAPLLEHLIEPFDGGLAVSTRAFHVFPAELMRKFHRFSIWREQLGAYALPWANARETTLEPQLIADAVAFGLRERLVAERYGRISYAADVLDTVAIIPEIDTLVFAPLVPFVDTYYNVIDETPLTRWRLNDFYHPRPRGKLLYEKLRDHLGQAQVQQIIDSYLHADNGDFVHIATGIAGKDVGALLQPWLGRYPRLNYALSHVESTAAVTHLDVVSQGPDAQAIVEPIQVDMQDADGTHHRQTRQGPGPVEFTAPGPARRIQIDPDGRLAELFHEVGYGSGIDNTEPPRWRFLLNDLTGLLAVTNWQVTAAADFSLRRLYDLTYSFDASIYYSPSDLSLSLYGLYHFGSEITPLVLTQVVSLSLSYDYLRPGFIMGAIPGNELSLTASYAYDNRLNRYASFEGFGVDAYATAGAGIDVHGNRYNYAQLGVGVLQIWPINYRHAIVTRLRADVSLGVTPLQDQFPLGGRYLGGRGFEVNEAQGTRRAVASAEYRHILGNDLRTDFFGVLLLSRFEGAFFADAVYLPVQRAGCGQDMFYDVGYGLHFLGDILSISPGALAVDIGLPLNRCPDQSYRLPITVYLAFVQSFAAF